MREEIKTPGKARPSFRSKTLANVEMSNLSETDKKCIKEIFERYGDSERVANDIVQKIKRERNSVLEEVLNRLTDSQIMVDVSNGYGRTAFTSAVTMFEAFRIINELKLR